MTIVLYLNFLLVLRGSEELFNGRLLDYWLVFGLFFWSVAFLFFYVGLSMHVLLGYLLDLKKEVVLIFTRLQSKTGKILVIVRILPQSVLGERT